MKVESYLFFDGRCEEAMEFYRSALGAKLEFLMRYKESPEKASPGKMPLGFEEKVMHASLLIGETRVMASDDCQGNSNFQGFSLSIRAADEAEAKKLFGALADGGEVVMPLAKTFFSPSFGMATDRFGVTWMIMVEGDKT